MVRDMASKPTEPTIPAPWLLEDLAQAKDLQRRLAARLVIRGGPSAPRTVAGVDVHFSRDGRWAWGAAVLVGLPGLEVLESAGARLPLTLPYRPGFLSFREAPAALAALKGLGRRPDLLLCDGQGIAHPRRFGLACHLGLAAKLPAIGVAKSRLVGEYAEPGPGRGDWSPLHFRGRRVGLVLRTRAGVRPVFVSPGHRVGMDRCRELVMACTGRFRLPEPLRAAHNLARRLREDQETAAG